MSKNETRDAGSIAEGRRKYRTENSAGNKETGRPEGKTRRTRQSGNAVPFKKRAEREDWKKSEKRTEKGDWKKTPRKKIPGQYCPVERRCGGCQYLNRTYEEQLALKQAAVKKLLGGYCHVHPITGMEDPFHYRNKVHTVFTHGRNGSVLSGIYEEGTHTVVPVEECLLENKKADEIIGSIRELLKSFKIKTYDEDTGYGLFRHALIRTAHQTGQIMVVLVLASPILPSKNNFVKALRALHPEITTIVLNVNDKKTSMVLGDRETILYGKGYIEDVLCGCRFRISAKSFYQINSVQTERLYGKAMELAGLTGKERVIDAYCGIGTIGLVASKHAGEVIGVELNPDAVRDAVRNAKANEARNVQFYQNDAGKFMVQMAQEGEKADVVFMDPPRSGSDEAFLSSVVSLSPKRIVYISCNPETQARDLQYLTRHGYRAEGIWPYDMFPFTNHVETICCLSRIK
jgi:23S rRNA (uracil1939-C5)-methyltransferase